MGAFGCGTLRPSPSIGTALPLGPALSTYLLDTHQPHEHSVSLLVYIYVYVYICIYMYILPDNRFCLLSDALHRVLQVAEGGYSVLAVSVDEAQGRLYTTSSDNKLRIWDLHTGPPPSASSPRQILKKRTRQGPFSVPSSPSLPSLPSPPPPCSGPRSIRAADRRGVLRGDGPPRRARRGPRKWGGGRDHLPGVSGHLGPVGRRRRRARTYVPRPPVFSNLENLKC